MSIVKGQIKENRDIVVADVNYRQIKALNYSMIVKYEKSPSDFVREFIMGEEVESEDTAATLVGNVIDDILLTYQGNYDDFESNFDSRYALYSGKVGSGQVFLLADELFSLHKRMPDEDFADRFRMAFDNIQKKDKYKGKKVEAALKDFEDNALDYYKTKVDNIGKMVVSIGLLEKARKIAENSLTDPYTKDIYDFNISSDNYQRLAKIPITFKFKGVDGEIEGKCEVDQMDVDYTKKLIIPRDTKSTYDNTLFPYNYLKNKYYIQAGWYTLGIMQWAEEEGLKDFFIKPYEFVTLDTSNGNRRPLRYQLDATHIDQAWKGFKINGRSYRGINELVGDIIWSNERCEWGTTKQAFLNNGVIKMDKV